MKLKVLKRGAPVEASYVVCVPAGDYSPFASTNVRGTCSLCGCEVQHRPYVPAHVPLACLACYLKMHKPDDNVVVERRAIDELLALGRNN